MAIRRGISGGASNEPAPKAQVLGRAIVRSAPSVTAEPIRQPSRIITEPTRPTLREALVRGLLVDGTGKPLRGLSQQTIEAHKAHTENATELCGGSCGEMHPPAKMTTVVGNAYNANNPLKLCPACAKLAYKDPRNEQEKWKPAVPAVRFDRETAAPYDAKARGVSIGDLVTKDTYHNEREVDQRFVKDSLPQEGVWSGGGRAGHRVTADSVARSRDRAARRR